jgi:ligand-binding sensor domain-containing protein
MNMSYKYYYSTLFLSIALSLISYLGLARENTENNNLPDLTIYVDSVYRVEGFKSQFPTNGDSLIFNLYQLFDSKLSELPSWVILDKEKDQIVFSPEIDDLGNSFFVLNAKYFQRDSIASDTFGIEVKKWPQIVLQKPMNDVILGKRDSLIITLEDSTFYETNGEPLNYSYTAISKDDGSVDLSSWITLDVVSGTFNLKPDENFSSVHDIILKAISNNLFASDTFQISLINHEPIINKPLTGMVLESGFQSTELDISAVFSDPDNDTMVYTIGEFDSNIIKATLANNILLISEVSEGQSVLSIIATDVEDASITDEFTIFVKTTDEVFSFTTENTGSNSLIDSWVTSLDVSGDMLIIGTRNGLSQFNPVTNDWSSFLNEAGFEQENQVKDVHQDSKGNLVLAVERGFQIGGETGFDYYDRSTVSGMGEFVTSSIIDGDDNVWFTAWDNSEIYLRKLDLNTMTITFSEKMFTTDVHVGGITLDLENRPWIATTEGVLTFEEGTGFTTYDETTLTFKETYGIFHKDGIIYTVHDGGINIYNGTEVSFIANPMLYNTRNGFIKVDDDGNVWTCGSEGIFRYHEQSGWDMKKLNFLGDDFAFGYQIYDFLITPNNHAFIATRWGLLAFETADDIFTNEPVVYNTFDGLPSNNIFKILSDDRGNMWFPTELNGLSKYNRVDWEWLYASLPVESAIWLQNTTAAYIAKNGDIWLGGAGGLSRSADGESWTSYKSKIYGSNESLSMANVLTIGEDVSGNIWAGGTGWEEPGFLMGLDMFNGENWTSLTENDGLKSGMINQIFGDSGGNMWVTYSQEDNFLTKIDSEGNMAHFDGVPLFPISPEWRLTSSILETDNGEVWFSIYGHDGINIGITKYDGNSWSYFDRSSGLLSGNVRQMTRDGLGNIWIAYDPEEQLGISMFNGEKWEHFTKANGLPTDQINSLQVLVTSDGPTGGRVRQTVGGVLWLGSNEGVIELDIDIFLDQNVTENILSVREAPEIILYPNPAKDYAILKFSEATHSGQLILTDLNGVVLKKYAVSKGDSNISLDLSGLSRGTFFIKSSIDGSVNYHRIIVE